MKIRINKYISEAGICSRRDADRKILHGKVRLNGRPAELGDMVDDSDEVLVDGNPIRHRVQRVYLAYNKPEGVTSTTDSGDPDNIIKAVGYHAGRIFPVGRLDKDSEGLILLTNDGDIVNKILRVSNMHDKEYIVTVDKQIGDDFIKRMSGGVSIMGVVTRKCKVDKVDAYTFRIILNQGLNRQIRRMCKVLGYKVRQLRRIRVMNIKLDGIPLGTWRFLTDSEISDIQKMLVGSTSVEKKKPRKPMKPGLKSRRTPGKAPESAGKSGRRTNPATRRGAKRKTR